MLSGAWVLRSMTQCLARFRTAMAYTVKQVAAFSGVD
jgi:hypothetical protein